MDDKEKKLLGELYAIRTVLSVISQNEDKSVNLRYKKEKAAKLITHTKEKISRIEKDFVKTQKAFSLDDKLTETQSKKSDYESEIAELIKRKSEYGKFIFAKWINSMIWSLCLIPVFGIGLLMILFAPIYFFYNYLKKNHYFKKSINAKNKELTDLNTKLQELILLKNENILYYPPLMFKDKEDMKNADINSYNNLIKENLKKLTEYQCASSSLRKQSSILLDVSLEMFENWDIKEWKYIDYAIYYIDKNNFSDIEKLRSFIKKRIYNQDKISHGLNNDTQNLLTAVNDELLMWFDKIIVRTESKANIASYKVNNILNTETAYMNKRNEFHNQTYQSMVKALIAKLPTPINILIKDMQKQIN